MKGNQGKDEKLVGPQGSYDLEGGNPLNKSPGKTLLPRKTNTQIVMIRKGRIGGGGWKK